MNLLEIHNLKTGIQFPTKENKHNKVELLFLGDEDDEMQGFERLFEYLWICLMCSASKSVAARW